MSEVSTYIFANSKPWNNDAFLAHRDRLSGRWITISSNHSPGWEMDIAAVTMGANLLEKTITEDRTTKSVEHIMSLEPQEMKTFINAIRDLEISFGSNRRTLSSEERKKRDLIRRSLFISKDTEAGDLISKDNIDFRRPGNGISPDMFEKLIGSTINKKLSAGHKLTLNDIDINE